MKKEDPISEAIRKFGARRRARLAAESELSFRRYVLKMVLALSFLLLDGLVIPSVLQSFDLLTVGLALPIGAVFIAVAAVQVRLLSKFA